MELMSVISGFSPSYSINRHNIEAHIVLRDFPHLENPIHSLWSGISILQNIKAASPSNVLQSVVGSHVAQGLFGSVGKA